MSETDADNVNLPPIPDEVKYAIIIQHVRYDTIAYRDQEKRIVYFTHPHNAMMAVNYLLNNLTPQELIMHMHGYYSIAIAGYSEGTWHEVADNYEVALCDSMEDFVAINDELGSLHERLSIIKFPKPRYGI